MCETCPCLSETQEALSEHQETILFWGRLAQDAHGPCGVSLLGDTQKLSERDPGKLSVGGPA